MPGTRSHVDMGKDRATNFGPKDIQVQTQVTILRGGLWDACTETQLLGHGISQAHGSLG